MSLVDVHPHNNFSSAILIRDYMKLENIYKRVQGTVEIITIVMPGVVVHSVYMPLNNQHIEDGYLETITTGTVFVDLSAAYDTVNHRLLI